MALKICGRGQPVQAPSNERCPGKQIVWLDTEPRQQAGPVGLDHSDTLLQTWRRQREGERGTVEETERYSVCVGGGWPYLFSIVSRADYLKFPFFSLDLVHGGIF